MIGIVNQIKLTYNSHIDIFSKKNSNVTMNATTNTDFDIWDERSKMG